VNVSIPPSPPSGPENGGLRLLGAIVAGTLAVVGAVLTIRADGWPALAGAFLVVLAAGAAVLWVVASMTHHG
jgi:hypothetical protein